MPSQFNVRVSLAHEFPADAAWKEDINFRFRADLAVVVSVDRPRGKSSWKNYVIPGKLFFESLHKATEHFRLLICNPCQNCNRFRFLRVLNIVLKRSCLFFQSFRVFYDFKVAMIRK